MKLIKVRYPEAGRHSGERERERVGGGGGEEEEEEEGAEEEKAAQQVGSPTCSRRDAPVPAEPAAAAGGKPGWCNRQKAGEGTASPGQRLQPSQRKEG